MRDTRPAMAVEKGVGGVARIVLAGDRLALATISTEH